MSQSAATPTPNSTIAAASPADRLLTHSIAFGYLGYLAITVVALIPDYGAMASREVWATLWHYFVVLILAWGIYRMPIFGPASSVIWSAVVPFNLYAWMFAYLSGQLCPEDGVPAMELLRTGLLLSACLLSAIILVVRLSQAKPKDSPALSSTDKENVDA